MRYSLACVVAGALSLGGCGAEIPIPVQSILLSVDNEPLRFRGASDLPGALSVQSLCAAGDTIETRDSSRASLALLPNALVIVEANTRLKIVDLALRKDGNETAYDSMREKRAHVHLERGTIFGSQERPDVAAEPVLTMDTADGSLVSSFDTTFEMMRDQRGTRVVCASGLLYFQPRGQRDAVELEGGSFGEWSADAGHVAAVESDAAAQAELSEVLEVVPKLRALRDAQRNKLPVVRGR
ncbi:MAG: hypothetical protein M3Y69_08325 [Verrucomicrobiota bacterium]|nr:hypothetical protein [Verrucomicrobiota bacterium]